jgi:hypothetical protein
MMNDFLKVNNIFASSTKESLAFYTSEQVDANKNFENSFLPYIEE